MKKLTRDEMKNVKGGLDTPPPGCFCYTPDPLFPFGGLDPDCYLGANPELYCSSGQLLACC